MSPLVHCLLEYRHGPKDRCVRMEARRVETTGSIYDSRLGRPEKQKVETKTFLDNPRPPGGIETACPGHRTETARCLCKLQAIGVTAAKTEQHFAGTEPPQPPYL